MGGIVEAKSIFRRQQVDLVQDFDHSFRLGNLIDAEIGQHREDIGLLGLALGMRNIAHMDDDIGLKHLFQCRPEGGNQMGG